MSAPTQDPVEEVTQKIEELFFEYVYIYKKNEHHSRDEINIQLLFL